MTKDKDDVIINNEIVNDINDGDEDYQDDGILDRFVIPYRHTYTSSVLSLSYWSDKLKVFVPISGKFEIMYQPYGKNLNTDRQQRLETFIDSIEGSFFIPSTSEINPLFCNGTIKNVSFEMPVRELSHAVISSFIYYKACAMLGEYADIMVFKFIPTFVNTVTYIEIALHQTCNPYIDEDEWLDEMLMTLEDNDTEDDIDENMLLPWWHRDDPTTRDYCYGNFSNTPAISIHLDIHELPENEFAVYPLYYDEDGDPILFSDDGEIYKPDNSTSDIIVNTNNTVQDNDIIAKPVTAVDSQHDILVKLGKLMNSSIEIKDDPDDIIMGNGSK